MKAYCDIKSMAEARAMMDTLLESKNQQNLSGLKEKDQELGKEIERFETRKKGVVKISLKINEKGFLVVEAEPIDCPCDNVFGQLLVINTQGVVILHKNSKVAALFRNYIIAINEDKVTWQDFQYSLRYETALSLPGINLIVHEWGLPPVLYDSMFRCPFTFSEEGIYEYPQYLPSNILTSGVDEVPVILSEIADKSKEELCEIIKKLVKE